LAVQALLSAGYTVRDIGRMLGLSPQRVSQISNAHAAGRAKEVATKPTRGTGGKAATAA
jgi:predicted transcriptional regulator